MLIIHLVLLIFQVANRSSSVRCAAICRTRVAAIATVRSISTIATSANTVATRNASKWACAAKVSRNVSKPIRLRHAKLPRSFVFMSRPVGMHPQFTRHTNRSEHDNLCRRHVVPSSVIFRPPRHMPIKRSYAE